MALAAPATNFATLKLPAREIRVDRLHRISGHDSGEPYFGKRGVYRFDDPARRYGTCYCGLDLDTAIAESILHDELPIDGVFELAESQLTSRYLVKFAPRSGGATLTFADLTGHSLKRLGADNAISSEYPYGMPQAWSAAVHAHPANVDGILFVSRQLNTKKAAVLFDRASRKLGTATYADLSSVRGLAAAKARLGIRVVFP